MSHLKSVEGRTSCSANLMGEEILVGRKKKKRKSELPVIVTHTTVHNGT